MSRSQLSRIRFATQQMVLLKTTEISTFNSEMESKLLKESCPPYCAAEEKSKHKIIRRSDLLNMSDEQFEAMKERCVGAVEIESSARVALNQRYKDVATMLQLDQETQICADYRAALKTHRQQLSNRYHVNFKFFLNLSNQEIGALGSLRRMGLLHYPKAQDIHTIVFKIIPVTCLLLIA